MLPGIHRLDQLQAFFETLALDEQSALKGLTVTFSVEDEVQQFIELRVFDELTKSDRVKMSGEEIAAFGDLTKRLIQDDAPVISFISELSV